LAKCRQPRKLKYPTQKSARSATCSVSSKAGKSDLLMLSNIRGIALPLIIFHDAVYRLFLPPVLVS
jgi:hypothetical protein